VKESVKGLLYEGATVAPMGMFLQNGQQTAEKITKAGWQNILSKRRM